jgi:hypothetical protein
MGKAQETPPLGFNFDSFSTGPFGLIEPWLRVQASMISAMKVVTDHWYERRTADIATVQKAATRLAGCTTIEGLVEAQTQCASALAERFMVDLAGLQEDVLSVSTSATSVLGDRGANGTSQKGPKAA